MELTKRFLHMDGQELQASKQVVLEDHVIIPDSNQDADKILLDRGKITIEEVLPDEDVVKVKGTLRFQVLYLTEGASVQGSCPVSCMEGKLPFEEKIQMEGIHQGGRVSIRSDVEELNVSLINSRKLSVRAIILLHARSEEMVEEEIPVDLCQEETVEYRKRSLEISSLVMKNQDLFRIKEEIEIPGSYPNIRTLIYWDADLNQMDFKPAQDQLLIQGELKVFCMYLGDGEVSELYHYETTMPVSGNVACPGIREGMLAQVDYDVQGCEMSVRPDYDGEDRILGLEMEVHLSYRIYEEDTVEMIGDVYGVSSETDTHCKPVLFRKFVQRSSGKCKLSGSMKSPIENANIYRVIHSVGDLLVESREQTDDGILISGKVCIRLLYEDHEETKKYGMISGELPFEYLLETDGCAAEEVCVAQAAMEQLAVSVIDTDEVDVKCVLLFGGDLFRTWEEEVMEQVILSPLDMEHQAALPGIAVYRIREGESLWDIGKRYYVPIDVLMQTNHLATQEVHTGDKILIVR